MIKANDSERREYFRINDRVYMDYEIVDDDEYANAANRLENLDSSAFVLSADFASLNNSIHPVLKNIRQSSPDIATYLEFINNKIDRLNQQLMLKESGFDESSETDVNLSASGISFTSEDPFEISQALKLEIVLLPEKVGIIVFGRIVSIKKDKKQRNWISIQFDHIRDEDRELMIKHNLNKQMEELREKNDFN